LADPINEEGTPPTQPPRLTDEDALRIWRARDVHEGRQHLIGCLTLFVLLEFFLISLAGGWYIGLLLVALQWGLWLGLRSALRWALRWTSRWQASWQARHTPPTKGPYGNSH
jgi:hypothetical protein